MLNLIQNQSSHPLNKLVNPRLTTPNAATKLTLSFTDYAFALPWLLIPFSLSISSPADRATTRWDACHRIISHSRDRICLDRITANMRRSASSVRRSNRTTFTEIRLPAAHMQAIATTRSN